MLVVIKGAGDLASGTALRLHRAGFRVDCAIRGLGELPAVREMYVERAREAMRMMAEEQKMIET